MSGIVTGFSPEVRDAILLRDGGLCGMLGAPGCDGAPAVEANHRLNRGMGGSALAEVASDPSNGCGLSHWCNWRIEAHAPFAEEARRRGVKVMPGRAPSMVPMWSVFFRQWVVLAPGGLFLTGCVEEWRDARLGRLVGSELVGFRIEWEVA